MKLTTIDIIKMIPFGEEFKKQLLADFDNFTPDRKFNVAQVVWDAYSALYEIRLDKNTKEALMLAEDGKESLDTEFYKRIKDKTKQEMQNNIVQAETTVDLSETREALQNIISGGKSE